MTGKEDKTRQDDRYNARKAGSKSDKDRVKFKTYGVQVKIKNRVQVKTRDKGNMLFVSHVAHLVLLYLTIQRQGQR